MPKCTDETVEFGRVGRRVVQAAFDGGDIVSDGGVLLLKRVDERLGLTRAAALAFGDERRSASVVHSLQSVLAQRIYGLCLGWSDVCDHNVLRNDLVMQTAVGRDQPLASAPTLSRLETGATPEHAAALHEVLMQQFIASHAKAPKELVLDVDATHVPLHGEQERGHFHAYYDNYCYLPLYVFAGQDMLACVLRPSDRDPASVVSALIKRLLVPLRRAWPKTKIIVRADSGFCRPRVLQRLERWGVNYIMGLQKNSRLAQQVELAELALAEQYTARQSKQRMLGEFEYAAHTWTRCGASSRGLNTARKVPTRASSSPTWRAHPKRCTSGGTALAAKPRTGSRKRSLTCSGAARVATASRPTNCGCCWRRWPTR